MSFGHWLKGATRIRFDDRTLGNLTKNAAVGVGTAVGGPLGLAIGAGGGALGQAALGGNLKDSLHAGFQGAANTGFAQAGKGLLSHVGGGAGPLVNTPTAPSTIPPLPGPSMMGANGIPGIPAAPGMGAGEIVQGTAGNALGRAASGAGKVFDWASEHPNAAAGALQGLGSIAGSGAENRTHNAQADLLEKQAQETEYDFQKRKARDAQLAPVWSSLGQTVGNNYAGVAKNPYLPGA